MNVFDCAIKIEDEVKSYYEGLEAESCEPELKHLFSLLAASKKSHRDRLMRLRRRSERAKPQLDALNGAACSFSPALSQRELLEEAGRDPDLYRFTVKEEENEISFYEELAARARDEATRRSLKVLAKEERRHLETVESIYDFVEAPKYYLAYGEFSNLHEL